MRRPPLDDQQRGRRVQPGRDDLGNVGKKQISGRPFAGRSGKNRPPGDLRLPRPLGLLTLLGVKRRTMQSEPRIPLQIRTLAPPGIDPNLSSPSANSHSMPEIRGEPSARNVAIARTACRTNRTRRVGRMEGP